MYDTDSATNEKYINLSLSNGALRFQYLNDAFAGGGDFVEFSRSGTSVLGMGFYDNAALKNFISNAGDSYFTSGSVGIGTTSPVKELHIAGTTPEIRLEDSNAATTSHFDMSLSDAVVTLRVDPDNTMANSTFRVNVDGPERMRVTSGGNVGIGTTNPGYRLESSGTIAVKSSAPDIKLIDTDGTSTHSIVQNIVNTDIYYSSIRTSADVFVGYIHLVDLGASGPTLQRWYTSGSEKMRLANNGRLGIGTTNPLEALHVVGNQAFEGSFSSIKKNNTSGGIVLTGGTDTNNGANVVLYGETSALPNTGVFEADDFIVRAVDGGSISLRITGLPTSSAGLITGEVWNDGGTLKIV
jgi:hypothetical protein